MPPRKNHPSPAVSATDKTRQKVTKSSDAYNLTVEEKSFLATQLSLLAKQPGGASAATTKDIGWSATVLPMLALIAEKTFKLAADNFSPLTPPEAPPASAAISSPVGGGPQKLSKSTSSAVAPTTDVVTPLSDPIMTVADFSEESAYLVEQLKQLPWAPFTYQRLLELLNDPYQVSPSKDASGLRGSVLQAALRRCILVTFPCVGETEM